MYYDNSNWNPHHAENSCAYLPRPLRDIFGTKGDIRRISLAGASTQTRVALTARTQRGILAVARTALAAATAFAMLRIGPSMLVTGMACCVLSLPATLIAAGGILGYYSICNLASSVALGNLGMLGLALLQASAGGMLLKYHDNDSGRPSGVMGGGDGRPVGVLEFLMEKPIVSLSKKPLHSPGEILPL